MIRNYLKKSRFLFFVLIIFSCEYNLNEENFVEVDKPSETHMFSLSLDSTVDTIKVFNSTEFSYDINTFGLDILRGKISLGDSSWNIYSKSGSFLVNPDDLEPGYKTLKLSIYTNSGSGSISDLYGEEGYMAEKEWTLLIDSRPAPILKLYKTITPEGYLKITWDKCDQYNFDFYELIASIHSNYISKKIFDPDSTFYIDSLYAGSYAIFNVNSYVKTEEGRTTWGESFYLEEDYPTIFLEEKGIDSIRVYWNKSLYHVKYLLTNYSNTLGLDFLTDTSITLEQSGFGESETYTLYTYPFKLNEYDYRFVMKDAKYYYLGRIFPGSWSYTYNHISKLIYTNRNNELECYDITNLNLVNSIYINYLQYVEMYACNTNSNKVAVMSNKTGLTDEIIYVYDDHTFQNQTILPFALETVNAFVDHFYLTDNNIIAVAYSSIYELINVNTQLSMGKLNIADYPTYSRWACFSTSKDGKYMCYVTLNGLYLYNIENGAFNLIYSDNRSYRSVLFDENNPDLLYITLNGSDILETRNVNAFALINTITLEAKSLVIDNIDPETGYMLLTNYNYIYLKNLANSELMLKIKSEDRYPKIFNNRLFTTSSYTIDISSYIKK